MTQKIDLKKIEIKNFDQKFPLMCNYLSGVDSHNPIECYDGGSLLTSEEYNELFLLEKILRRDIDVYNRLLKEMNEVKANIKSFPMTADDLVSLRDYHKYSQIWLIENIDKFTLYFRVFGILKIVNDNLLLKSDDTFCNK